MINKKCGKCGVTKKADDFHADKSTNSGLKNRCKSCVKVQYEKAKEKYCARQREYYKENIEKMRKKNRIWYQNNKEARAKYYQDNKEEIEAKVKLDRKENPEKYAETEKRRWKTPGRRYSHNKYDAKRRNIDFNISLEEYKDFWQKPCAYCGVEIETIGIDRMNNDEGYHVENVVSCCHPCNTRKGSKSLEKWLGELNEK
jgi:hypothetical protein